MPPPTTTILIPESSHGATVPAMSSNQAETPHSERTVGQLIADAIRLYGHRFWRGTRFAGGQRAAGGRRRAGRARREGGGEGGADIRRPSRAAARPACTRTRLLTAGRVRRVHLGRRLLRSRNERIYSRKEIVLR